MKRKLILASHGDLAKGLLGTAKMILGEMEYETQAFGLQPGHHPDEFVCQVRQEIEKDTKRETEFVILCDLFGASVCTAFYPLASYENVKLFTGMNLNMLLSICVECKMPLNESDAERVINAGRTGIRLAGIMDTETEEF